MSDTDLVGAGEYQGELIEVKKYSSLFGASPWKEQVRKKGLPPLVEVKQRGKPVFLTCAFQLDVKYSRRDDQLQR